MHFTRQRRHATVDLTSTIHITSCETAPQKTSMQVLRIQVDPKLQQKEQVKKAASKGLAAFKAILRITISTQGPLIRRSRLLYTATIQLVILYRAQVQGVQDNGGTPAKSLIKPLQKIQNKCLYRVIGIYQQILIAIIEKGAAIPLIQLYIKTTAL